MRERRAISGFGNRLAIHRPPGGVRTRHPWRAGVLDCWSGLVAPEGDSGKPVGLPGRWRRPGIKPDGVRDAERLALQNMLTISRLHQESSLKSVDSRIHVFYPSVSEQAPVL